MTPVRSRPSVVIASYPVLLLSIILSTLTSVCHHSCLAWHVVTHMVSGGNTAAQVGLALSNTFSHLGTEPSSTCRGAPAPPWPRWPAPCTDSLWGDVSLHCSEYLQHPLVLWEHLTKVPAEGRVGSHSHQKQGQGSAPSPPPWGSSSSPSLI